MTNFLVPLAKEVGADIVINGRRMTFLVLIKKKTNGGAHIPAVNSRF